MSLSVFDMFSIGIGPSSSHTVGPMRAARQFVETLAGAEGGLEGVESVKVELFGSLGHTGKGHGSDVAVILGLEGERPEELDCDGVPARISGVTESARLKLLGQRSVKFKPSEDIVFHKRQSLPRHPNGMRFSAMLTGRGEPFSRAYYSVGGGFVVNDDGSSAQAADKRDTALPYPFKTGVELLSLCQQTGLSISTLMLENEKVLRPEAVIRSGLVRIWEVMQACVKRGCEREGILPGGLKVKRRAAAIYRRLRADTRGLSDPLIVMDWVNLFALAVNEENAAGGRVVTAPTNGAAGIVPAVLHYYRRFVPNADDEGAIRFLLTAGAMGMLYKLNASISGAEVGCQGEVGVACSMAAAGLAEVMGGTPEQVAEWLRAFVAAGATDITVVPAAASDADAAAAVAEVRELLRTG